MNHDSTNSNNEMEKAGAGSPMPPRRPPISAVPLGYAPVEPQRGRLGLQFLAGFLFPIAYTVVAAWIPAILDGAASEYAALAALIGFFVSLIVIRVTTGWRAFIPGALAMVLGMPLLAAGVCAAYCAFN